jgi:hypothetical protein
VSISSCTEEMASPYCLGHAVLLDGRHILVLQQIANVKLTVGPPCEMGTFDEAW